MTERNKNEFKFFARMGALIVWLMLVIITCAGNWNWNPEGFVDACTIILFVINLGTIGYLFWKWRKEHNDAIEAIQKAEREALKEAANKK